ncbi:MCE family protein [Mycolicibacterium sp. XJ1819]
MNENQRTLGVHPAFWALLLVTAIVGTIFVVKTSFNRDFRSYARVTVTTDRSGLQMEPKAKVKFRGVEIGRVATIQPGDPVQLQLELYDNELQYIPENATAQITAPTVFGNKAIELIAPDDPSPKRLAAGDMLTAREVSIEANSVLENLVDVLDQIDVAKLNSVLSALGEGFRGKGEAMGEAVTDFNEVLLALNPRSETISADIKSVQGFADTYSAAAQNLVTVLDAGTTVATTFEEHATELEALLLNVVGLSNSGINLLGASKDNLVHLVDILEPTTRLLNKYNPVVTCTLKGFEVLLDHGWADMLGGYTGKSMIGDAALLFGDDAYRYPDHLPITGAKGGYGGTPSCGSLPDVADNWPVRYMVTNTGFGTGLDVRPNPGIGFPGWANYFPVTRAVPESPSVRNNFGGPAIGPIPYPGAPPYGAKLYAPDGAPLWPGLPPAPPPGRPAEPGPPPPGSEPSVPAVPAGIQPTPVPHLPGN